MIKNLKKFILNKMFKYGKFLMTSRKARFFFIIASLLAVLLSITETGEALFWEYKKEFSLANKIFAIIFTIEFILRFLSFERKKLGKRKFIKLRYLLKPSTIIDILTIAPFYLYIFYPLNITFKALRIFRILNLIQFSKLDRLTNKILRFIKHRKTAIVATILIAIAFIIIIATLMYLCERKAQPDVFGSVYNSLWWCIVTVTAVGYGDIVPVTVWGKIIGSITCFAGILLVIVPVSIFSSGLASIKSSKKKHKLLRARRKGE